MIPDQASPTSFEVSQPNGDTFKINIRGNFLQSWYEYDGSTILKGLDTAVANLNIISSDEKICQLLFDKMLTHKECKKLKIALVGPFLPGKLNYYGFGMIQFIVKKFPEIEFVELGYWKQSGKFDGPFYSMEEKLLSSICKMTKKKLSIMVDYHYCSHNVEDFPSNLNFKELGFGVISV